MKLKFPKKIMIGDREWTVKLDNTTSGGGFEYATHILTIGTRQLKKQPQSTLSVIIHELKEIIQVENDTRFDRGNNVSDYMFVYGHNEHTDICRRLSGLLTQFIK